ncbi:MAG TPA: ferritin-like domain-containing protein [Rhodothermales bacterium]|nr:ferritin-like domain-containing protein [Rhodothermales bacterium]
MSLNSLNALFLHELRDLYSAEHQLLKALPQMAQAATHTELKQAFNDHLEETRNQVSRLDRIFSLLGEHASGEHCNAMEGLIEEGKGLIEKEGNPDVKDAALIAAAQRVEHYEIAGYGTAHTFAKLLDHDGIAELLQETLDEEGDANKTLNKIATGGLFGEGINEEALAV